MRVLLAMLAVVPGTAVAASGPFLSLGNTTFVTLISFIIFVGVIFYFKAPAFVARLIDGQIDSVRKEIDEARTLREDAEDLLARTRKERNEAEERGKAIVEGARQEAQLMVTEATRSIERVASRRLQAAEEQIASAEAAAVAEIRSEAVRIAVEAAGEAISRHMSDADRKSMVAHSIREIDANLG